MKFIWLPLVTSFFFCIDASAQTCESELEEANRLYTIGQFEKSRTFIKTCFSKENVTSSDLASGYRLQALSFLGQGNDSEMRSSIIELMRVDSTYEPDNVLDPPAFVAILSEVKNNSQEDQQDVISEQEDAIPDQEEANLDLEDANLDQEDANPDQEDANLDQGEGVSEQQGVISEEAPSVPVEESKIVERTNYYFELVQCKLAGESVVCELNVTSKGDGEIFISRRNTRIFLGDGSVVASKYVRIGQRVGKRRGVQFLMFSGLAEVLVLSFEVPNPAVSYLQALEIDCNCGDNIVFENIPF